MTYVSESFWHDAVNKATTDLFTFGYKHIIKPNFVFNHRPDEAHDQMIEFCHVVKNVPPLLLAEQLMLDYTGPCRLRLRNRRLHHLASLPGQRQAVVPPSA